MSSKLAAVVLSATLYVYGCTLPVVSPETPAQTILILDGKLQAVYDTVRERSAAGGLSDETAIKVLRGADKVDYYLDTARAALLLGDEAGAQTTLGLAIALLDEVSKAIEGGN